MKLKVAVLGLGLGALALTGCGGGNGSDLPEASGKLSQSSASEYLEIIEETGLSPDEMLSNNNSAISKRTEKALTNAAETTEAEHPTEWTDGCTVGNKTTKIISGELHWMSDLNSSNYEAMYTYNDCGYVDHPIQNGVSHESGSWERDTHKESGNWSSSKDKGFALTLGTNKFTYDSYSASGKWSYEYTGDVSTNLNEKTREYNGLLTVDGEKIEFTSVKRFRSYIAENGVEIKNNWATDGAWKKDDTDGWIVLRTQKTFINDEEHDGCYFQGKLTISGKEHTLTKEVMPDSTIEIKYDGEVIETRSSCTR